MSPDLLPHLLPIRGPAKCITSAEDGSNSCSILEAFAKIEAISGKPMVYEYVEQNRSGDHICYISDLRKMKKHYPGWDITKSLDDIFHEIHGSWSLRAEA